MILVWLTLRTVGGGLPTVWGAFLITAPVTAVLTWRRFQRRLQDLAAERATPAGGRP